MMRSRFCNLCGQPLGARQYTYRRGHGGHALVVCPECLRHRERCTVCGAPVDDEHYQLRDGRRICTACHRTAIDDAATAQALFERVIGLVHGNLGLRVHIRPAFALVERSVLDELAAQIGRPALPAPTNGHLLGVYIKQGRQRRILVERGLPKLLMTKVIAHEYGHAWQGENAPFLRDPLFIEGFCEWVSYRTLQALGAVKEQRRLREAPGFYGDALRAVLAVEKAGGVQAVLERVRRPEPGR